MAIKLKWAKTKLFSQIYVRKSEIRATYDGQLNQNWQNLHIFMCFLPILIQMTIVDGSDVSFHFHTNLYIAWLGSR